MEEVYTNQMKKIEIELEKWLPGIKDFQTGSESSETAAAEAAWADLKKISNTSLQALLLPAKDMLSRGGKRWRPLLTTIICECLGGGDSALPLTPLIEFAHNATLVHDDIEDDAEERRGKPSIHKIHGVDSAINSGSYLYFLSLKCLEAYQGKNKDLIYKLWGTNLRDCHLGQAIDISWHRKVPFIPSVEEYLAMCSLKTGSLARLSAEIGAFCADASEDMAKKLGDAAQKLGVGFQILDDVKNLTMGVPGKKRGDDVVEGKKSLPILLYLIRYPEMREKVFYCFHAAKINGPSAPEIAELIHNLNETSVLKEAEEKARNLIDEARTIFSCKELTGSPISVKSYELLSGLIDLIS